MLLVGRLVGGLCAARFRFTWAASWRRALEPRERFRRTHLESLADEPVELFCCFGWFERRAPFLERHEPAQPLLYVGSGRFGSASREPCAARRASFDLFPLIHIFLQVLAQQCGDEGAPHVRCARKPEESMQCKREYFRRCVARGKNSVSSMRMQRFRQCRFVTIGRRDGFKQTHRILTTAAGHLFSSYRTRMPKAQCRPMRSRVVLSTA